MYNQLKRRNIIKLREEKKISNTPEEAIFKMLYPGIKYENADPNQIKRVFEWLDENSPDWRNE